MGCGCRRDVVMPCVAATEVSRSRIVDEEFDILP